MPLLLNGPRTPSATSTRRSATLAQAWPEFVACNLLLLALGLAHRQTLTRQVTSNDQAGRHSRPSTLVSQFCRSSSLPDDEDTAAWLHRRHLSGPNWSCPREFVPLVQDRYPSRALLSSSLEQRQRQRQPHCCWPVEEIKTMTSEASAIGTHNGRRRPERSFFALLLSVICCSVTA